ncbi:MAG: hypothetical protein Kow0010_15190 [Dehalococcoidia bacterium]
MELRKLPPALAVISPTRRDLLIAIKVRGEARVEELSRALSITPSAVRQHIASLEADGLLAHRAVKGKPGRPKFVFRLTPASEAFFPRNYEGLVGDLIDILNEEDPALVGKVFERRAERRLARIKERLQGKPLGDRVRELVSLLQDEGYLADLEPTPDGGYRIVEHNCALLAAAEHSPLVCESELRFFRRALPDASIERVARIVDGSARCAYEIR